MPNSILFGDKENFAIEIAATKKPATFKLCFWVNKIKIGLFTKAGKLNESIRAYNKFITHKENYYLPLFDEMLAEDIPFYILGLNKSTFKSNISSKEFEARTKHAFSLIEFGEPFYNSNNDVFVLYKSLKVLFIICEKGILSAKRHEVSIDDFISVFEQYATYCDENGIVLRVKQLNVEMLEFFSLYQYANFKQFKLIYGDHPFEGVEKMEPFIIQYDGNQFERNISNGIFYCLAFFSNIKDAPQQMIHFMFIDKMLTNGHAVLFAKDYQCDLYFGIQKKDGKIIIIEPQESKYIYIAKDESSFFAFLKCYLEYSIFTLSVAANEEMQVLYRNRCIELAGGIEFAEYYNYVFPALNHKGPWNISFPNSF